MSYKRKHIDLGNYGEKGVIRALRNDGYYADYAPISHNGDVYAIFAGKQVKIEVKTSLLGSRNAYQFCIKKDKHTDAKHADFLVMLAIDDCGLIHTFVIPTKELTVKSITLPKNLVDYNGKYAKYRVSSISKTIAKFLKVKTPKHNQKLVNSSIDKKQLCMVR